MGSSPSKPKAKETTKLTPFREPTSRRDFVNKTKVDRTSDDLSADVRDTINGDTPNIEEELRMIGTPTSSVNMNFKRASYGGVYNVKLYKNDEADCRIRGAEFLPNGNLLLCDQNNCNVKLFSDTFQYLNHLKLPAKPFDMCVHSTDVEGSDVYVTLPSLRKIVHIGVEQKDIVVGDTIMTDGWCYGIAPYSGGLVVSVGSKVKIIDTAGVVIKTIQYDGDGASMFTSPFYVAVTPYDELLISDTVKMCVLCINWEGEEIFRYDMADPPHGVTCNKDGCVFVCAGKDRQTSDVIHQVLVDGSAVTILLHWRHVGFVPDCVCYRPSDKLLLLAGQNNRVKTFKTDTKKSWKKRTDSRTSGSIQSRGGDSETKSILSGDEGNESGGTRRNMTIQDFQYGIKPTNSSRQGTNTNQLIRKSNRHGHSMAIPSRLIPEVIMEEDEDETGSITVREVDNSGYDMLHDNEMTQRDSERDNFVEHNTPRIQPSRRPYTHKVNKNRQAPGNNNIYDDGYPALTGKLSLRENDSNQDRLSPLEEIPTPRENPNIKDPPNKFVGFWKNYSGWKINDPYS